MKSILLLPFFRFGSNLTSLTIRTVEIYSRINKKEFNFIINLDIRTNNQAEKYHSDKLKNMEISLGYVGLHIIKLAKGFLITVEKAKRADYLLCESEYFYSVIYSYFIHLITRKPLILTVHQMEPEMYKRNNIVSFRIYEYIFFKTKRILILDNDTIIKEFNDNFQSTGGNTLKLFKILNGVDVGTFYTLDEKKYDLIFIGRIDERKNALLLPDIIEKVAKIKDNVKLLIIAHQGEIEKLKTLIAEKHLAKNFEIINYVSEEEKRYYLATSKIMIFPSKYEGFGIPIIEAMASYLPVVLFDIPSLKLFSAGVLKSKPFDIDEFVNNIAYLLKNDNKRKELGAEGRELVEHKYDYSIVSAIENNSIKDAIFDITNDKQANLDCN